MYYGCLIGLGTGINYFIPLLCAWEYYPEHKGKITGVMLAAYSSNTFIFGYLS